MNITVSVNDVSKVSRKLKITIPQGVFASKVEQGLIDIQKTVELKGFRKGHAPLSIVRQKFEQSTKAHVFDNLIDESYKEAIVQEKLTPVGQPTIENLKPGPGELITNGLESIQIEYEATFEILPDFEVKDYFEIPLTKEKVEVSEKEVNENMTNFQNSMAEQLPLPEGEVGRGAKKGDFVDIEFLGKLVTETGLEEHPGMQGTKVFELGTKAFIEGFEENLEGVKSGEEKTFRVKFPKDYLTPKFADKEAEFTVKLKDIKLKNIPELNDDLAKKVGFQTLEELTIRVRENIKSRQEALGREKLQNDVIMALIKRNPIDIPPSFVLAQTNLMKQGLSQDLGRDGFGQEEIQVFLEKKAEEIKKEAEIKVKSTLLLEAVAKNEGITVKEEEIDSAVAARLAQYPKRMKKDMEKRFAVGSDGRRNLRYQIRETKAIQLLIDKAKVK